MSINGQPGVSIILKYDWNPIEVPETRTMYEALRGSGRDIVLSLSNSAPFAVRPTGAVVQLLAYGRRYPRQLE